jgi:hypothetical protein
MVLLPLALIGAQASSALFTLAPACTATMWLPSASCVRLCPVTVVVLVWLVPRSGFSVCTTAPGLSQVPLWMWAACVPALAPVSESFTTRERLPFGVRVASPETSVWLPTPVSWRVIGAFAPAPIVLSLMLPLMLPLALLDMLPDVLLDDMLLRLVSELTPLLTPALARLVSLAFPLMLPLMLLELLLDMLLRLVSVDALPLTPAETPALARLVSLALPEALALTPAEAAAVSRCPLAL